MAQPIRILLLADTHLGFDLPTRPRVRRRRRGHDFMANYERVLEAGLASGVDLVVHGGDLFHRPRVPASLAWQALEPLVRTAENGTPVVLVPGNHERSRIPHHRFARHPAVHVLDRPTTVRLEVHGARVAVAGFPFRRDVRARFPALLRRTGWRPGSADVNLLCVHQSVEGATVGPADFVFTTGDDVIRARDLPAGFDAVLSGHIHRHQVLTRDPGGKRLPAPVLYPGSVERTAVAEKDETKGYVTLEVAADAGDRPRVRWWFHPLPARPMLVREVDLTGLDAAALDRRLRAWIAAAPADAVLRIRTRGAPSDAARPLLAASRLRRIAPPEMNVEVREGGSGRRAGVRSRQRPEAALQIGLGL